MTIKHNIANIKCHESFKTLKIVYIKYKTFKILLLKLLESD